MVIDEYNKMVDFWTSSLEQYTIEQLLRKPSQDAWSVGQMYVHLIDDTTFFMDQIRICLTINAHSDEIAKPKVAEMLKKNDFPDEMIQGSPDNIFLRQPESKEQLMLGLRQIKHEMNQLAELITANTFHGKSSHPGLGYFNASEWLQFAEMHLRHHKRQKGRLDKFLFQLS